MLVSHEEKMNFWENLYVSNVNANNNLEYPYLNEFLKELRSIFGDWSVRFHKYIFKDTDSILVDYTDRGSLHTLYFFREFWNHPVVQKDFPEKLRDFNEFSTSFFSSISNYELSSTLSCLLSEWSAYNQTRYNPSEINDIGITVSKELLGGNYGDVNHVYISSGAWSDFFYDVAWDYTLLIINKDWAIIVLTTTGTD